MNSGTPSGYRRGVADLPLHYGKAPRWHFERMVKLAREVLGAWGLRCEELSWASGEPGGPVGAE